MGYVRKGASESGSRSRRKVAAGGDYCRGVELTRVTGQCTPSAPNPTLVALDRGPDELAVHVVDNGDLRLAFLPGVGGRLISVRCGGAELLWRNPE